jgi:actin-like ATPase involved in cell morphogenesis
MADEEKAFGEQLYSRLQNKGLSKYQVDKVVALQRLDAEVAELGEKGLLGDPQLLEISKINSAARQKQLAELAVEKNLPQGWVKELTKLVRSAEKARSEQEGNRYWDFFFEIKEMIEREGPTRTILQLIKNFSVDRAAVRQGKAELIEGTDRTVISFNKMELELGRGLDVGTVNICAAAKKRNQSEIVYNIQRNAFLDMRADMYTKKMLMKLGIDYIVQGDKGYVIGDPAFELANVFDKVTRRPMKDGMISPVEPEALLVVSLIIAEMLGHPKQQGEVCAFSVPADPIDVERNVIYHRGVLETVLRKLGYTPRPMLEGHSIVFSELKEQDFTGIGISCGGGMFNVCVAYKSVPALTFATSRGGDWIDNNVAHAIGMTPAVVCGIKESGVDLNNPKDRVQDAIVIYYRNLIQYTLETIKNRLETAQNMPTFTKPIDVVCGGGTSMITGFIDVFREEFEKINFPIEVARVRMANDPLKAVSRGCMVAAIEETRALNETDVQVAPAALERTTAQVSRVEEGTKRRLGPIQMPERLPGGPQRVAPVKVASPMPSSAPSIVPAAKVVKVDAPSMPPAIVRGRDEGAKVLKVAPPPQPSAAPKKETSVRIAAKPFGSNPTPPPPPPKKKEAELELVEVEEITELTPEPKKDDAGDDIPLIS